MAKKARRASVDFAVYLAVRVMVCLAQAVPVRVAFAAAEGLAWLAYRIDRRHRLVAAENLRHAFPGTDDAGIDRLVRGCYRHFVRVAVEMILLPRKIRMHNYPRYVRIATPGPVVRALVSREPVLLVTGHLGNWEMTGYMMGASGHRTYAVARVLDNPYLERFLLKFRQATGQTLIAKKDDFGRLQAVLEGGGKVGVLADQDAGPRGVFVDFFGRPASAHKGLALLAIEYDAPLLVAATVRVAEPMRYELVCEDIIRPRDYAGRPDAVKAITQRYHAALERLIRRHPEQYFWLHRRWKTRPKSETKRMAA
jgi:KDO2-lipid IV(A) lauroyltransferase